MKHDEFEAAVKRLFGTVAAAGRELDINPRTMRKYCADPDKVSASNALPVPPSLAAEVHDLLERFPNGVKMIDPREVIHAMMRQMVANGWTAEQSAASILGAAWANAVQVSGATAARALIEGAE